MISAEMGSDGPEVDNGFFHVETIPPERASPILYRDAKTPSFCHWCQPAGAAARFAAACPKAARPGHARAIKVDVDVVSVLASVRDKRGGLVSNLEKSDFTVLEDGKPQTIKYFSRETDLPLTIGLLIDVSGSQRNLIEIERGAASQFFSQVLRKKDLAFLISFGEEAELLQDSTSSPRLLTDGLERSAPQFRRAGPAPRPRPHRRTHRAAPSSTTPSTSRPTRS